MAKRLRSKKSNQVELDITSFMNLMVILIPFLLLNAVFTQVNVLSVTQPGASVPDAADDPAPLVLEVMAYPDRIELRNQTTAQLLAEVKAADYLALNQQLRALKAQHPQVSSATLYFSAQTPYQQVVQTMDTVRLGVSPQTGQTYALFPELQLASLEAAGVAG